MEVEIKKISVVMCTYNGARFIREQLDSILNQTYPIYELIIQDDCSTDETVEIVKEYTSRDKRIKLFINSTPLGFNYNFSSALFKASGDYIATSDQDDIWRVDKLQVLMHYINGRTLLFHNSYLFYESRNKTVGLKNANNIIYNDLYLLLKPFVPGHECFFSRNILPLYKSIVERERNISYDTLLLLVAISLGKVQFVNEGLVYWRRHPKATSFNTSHIYSDWKGILLAFKSLNVTYKRDISKRYFRAIQLLPFKSKEVDKIIALMIKNSLIAILESCVLCLLHRNKLYPHHRFLKSCVKSFFTPLYFLRDCTKFVIH